MKNFILAIIVVIAVSCQSPHDVLPAKAHTKGKYPDIASLQVKHFSRVPDLCTSERALNHPARSQVAGFLNQIIGYNQGRSALAPELSDADLGALSSLVAEDPELQAALDSAVVALQEAYESLPEVVVETQGLTADGLPDGDSFETRSEGGMIDLGGRKLSVAEFLLEIQGSEARATRGLVAGPDYERRDKQEFWPDRTVKYMYEGGISDYRRGWMEDQIELLHDATGIHFKRCEYNVVESVAHGMMLSDKLLIKVTNLSGPAGLATIGKVGSSSLTLDPRYTFGDSDATWKEVVFQHERLHVLGLLHEHQRHDRNNYVTVDKARVAAEGRSYEKEFDKIAEKNRHRFLLSTWTEINSKTLSTPYDYNSLTHERTVYFSLKNGNTFQWRGFSDNKSRFSTANQGTWLSPWDIYTVRKLYNFSTNSYPSDIPEGIDP